MNGYVGKLTERSGLPVEGKDGESMACVMAAAIFHGCGTSLWFQVAEV